MSISDPPQLHGAEIFSLTAVPLSVFRLSATGSLRHSHDFFELFLVTRGTGTHELFLPTGEMSEACTLTRGQLISIPLGWSHSYRQSTDLEIFNVLFSSQLLKKWPQILQSFSLFAPSSDLPTRWTLRRNECEHLETLLQSITRELLERRQGYELAAQVKMLDALVWIERLNCRAGERRNLEFEGAVSLAIAFMEQQLAHPIGLEDIAKSAHLSANYFCEVFKNATGLSPGRYLTRLRLEHARYLLLSTSNSITQISRESGFADANYFSRAFKEAYETAPSRLRSSRK